MGSPDRHRRAHPPARGPRRGPRGPARPVRGRHRLRARHARAWARLAGVERAARRRAAARPARYGRPDPAGRVRADGAVARPRHGPRRTARRRDRHQQRLDRAPRRGQRTSLPALRGCGAGHRPAPPRDAAAAARRPQGGPSRERDRDDAGVPRFRAAARGDRLGGDGEPVRASRGLDARAPAGLRRARVPDGPGRERRDRAARRRAARDHHRRAAVRRNGAGPRPGDHGAGTGGRAAQPVPVRHRAARRVPGLGLGEDGTRMAVLRRPPGRQRSRARRHAGERRRRPGHRLGHVPRLRSIA